MIRGKRSWEPLQMKEGSAFHSSKKTASTSAPEGTGVKIRQISLFFSEPLGEWVEGGEMVSMNNAGSEASSGFLCPLS